MSQCRRQSPRTAAPDQSIWKETPEELFRTHMIHLEERTNAVVVRPQVFSVLDRSLTRPAEARLLPLVTEQRLADDLAYITAVGEGAQSVSAVCVEEQSSPTGLTVRVASVDAVDGHVQDALQKLSDLLHHASRHAAPADRLEDSDELLHLIVSLHTQKLLGRLRSVKWQKPKYLSRTHKKPLSQDFDNLLHRVQFIYTKKRDPTRAQVEAHITTLAMTISTFENVPAGSNEEIASLLSVVVATYKFCQLLSIRDFTTKLESLPNATPQIAAAIKTVRQIEKIGAYCRIATDLASTAEAYPSLFRSVRFRFVQPYAAVETDIAYESWAKSMHVHAEIQLVTYYDLLPVRDEHSQACYTQRPRVIGTSKYFCYLCYLFISEHGLFVPCNTHGRLYDQWTVPDLAEFEDAIAQKYRRIIAAMDLKIVNMSNDMGETTGKRDAWRIEPMTSRQDLLLTPVSDMVDGIILADSIGGMSIA